MAVAGASRARLAVGMAAVLTLGGCSGGGKQPVAAPEPTSTAVESTAVPTTVAETTTTAPATPTYPLAVAKVRAVEIYNSPVQPEPARTLDNPQPDGAAPGNTLPLRMLVVEDRGDWLKVMLPVRPNGSTGWVRRSTVDVDKATDFRILVELGAHRITVWKGSEVVLQELVAVGAQGRTPTTRGLFYTTELYPVLPSQQSAYGPFAYSLSGFSEVHYAFGGGTGVLGIHGTADTSSLGRDVSNGCIRMSNSAITKLANTLPAWGVPVEITD